MDDDIFHFGIVDRALRGAAPCLFGRLIVRIEADDVEIVEVGKVEALRVADASAGNQGTLAHLRVPAGKSLGEGKRSPLFRNGRISKSAVRQLSGSSLRPLGSSEPSSAPIATAPATSASGCFSAASFSLLL